MAVIQSSIIERLLGFKGRKKVHSVGEIMDRCMEEVVLEVRLGE